MELDKSDTMAHLQQLVALRERIENLDPQGYQDASVPKLDLLDHGDAFELIAEVPGVPLDNLEVSIDEQEVIIAGLREPPVGNPALLVSERQSGHFQRSVELPEAVLETSSSAYLREGLLILHLPKA